MDFFIPVITSHFLLISLFYCSHTDLHFFLWLKCLALSGFAIGINERVLETPEKMVSCLGSLLHNNVFHEAEADG